MAKNELKTEYFKWMYQLVCNEKYFNKLSYRKLLHYLHSMDFFYIIEMDKNRAQDGIDLRYRFGYENSIDDSIIQTQLDNRPCSVLEMILALAIRCEEHIMDDEDIGNRTGQWFWNMIVNLDLGSMHDANMDENYANDILQRFLNREYERNGEGGLFTINNCDHDLRDVEIWYQMCWYLNTIL